MKHKVKRNGLEKEHSAACMIVRVVQDCNVEWTTAEYECGVG